MDPDPWRVPDVGMSDEDRIDALAIVTELFPAGDVAAAYVGGSLAVGLGHAHSDLDVYVVCRQPGPGDRQLLRTRRVHVNVVGEESARRLADLGSRFVATSADRSQLRLDLPTMSRLVRLATGVVLTVADDWAPVLASVDRTAVRQIVLGRNAIEVVTYAEDAEGALRSGDGYTALTASRLALECAGEAVLAAADDLYVGPKFLPRRLARARATRPLHAELWRLVHRQPVDRPDADRVVRHRLLAANHLVTTALLDGWTDPLRSATLPGGPGPGPLRSPFCAPMRFTNGFALGMSGRGFRVSENLLRLWHSLDGGPRPAAEPAAVKRALAALAGHGVVERSPVPA